MTTTFDHLIFPISADTFFKAYFENNSLHITNRVAEHYQTLFSIAEFERLLWENEESILQFVRVHSNGVDRNPIRNTGALDLFRWVTSEYRAGATLILNNLDRRNQHIAEYLRSIESTFRSRASVSAYLTPPNSQGFKIHFDTHDVFIAQISGAKCYLLYEEVDRFLLPLERHQRVVDPTDAIGRASEVHLVAGELLYIPRGVIHEAKTSEKESLHLSIGVHGDKIVDILKAMLDTAADRTARLRRSSRLLESASETPAVIDALADLLRDQYDLDMVTEQACTRLNQQFVGSLRGLPDNSIADGVYATVELADLVRKKRGAILSIDVDDNKVYICFPGLEVILDKEHRASLIALPITTIDALKFMGEKNGPFCAKDLPGNFSETAKLYLIRRLIEEGFLIRV